LLLRKRFGTGSRRDQIGNGWQGSVHVIARDDSMGGG
jgi:hypothetical protein